MTTDERGERRRLRAILSDEEYGPKLVRLSKSDQRTILDLISENKGREARKRILELDERRRETVRIGSRIRRARERIRKAAEQRIAEGGRPGGRELDPDMSVEKWDRRYTGHKDPAMLAELAGATIDEVRANAYGDRNAQYSIWWYH